MMSWLHKQIAQARRAQQRGFTLVEMVVVAAIFGVLTLIVVFKYGDFTSNILVTNMAYEIAMTTRQAQVFGVGARGYSVDDDTSFEYAYGVSFPMASDAEPARSFKFFIDRDDDGICGGGTCICGNVDSECLETLTLQRNIRITEVRTNAYNVTSEEGQNKKCQQATDLDISFLRPSPEARITRPSDGLDVPYEFAQIKVEAVGNNNLQPAYVLIRQTGQISVSSNDICI